ncbi:putative leucine-rich repeat-containing protein DDB_G0290503 isoform X2 [Manduca sexta]|uniref:putative leucine-rich repeat-containing protein DDB_G0290503 isoform X2 n=1 Tax=Manduca sexta TaxID=7130 RepID=UPI0018906112|nr:putative leucine-rich repeat-containing protein DDB_G0290503 isoform X2 [Manduca sexta]
MHHLYPLAKGDPLCPLGFHPQVRWPTRCKRCFRDYKEHGGGRKREDDFTASTPSLATWNSPSSRSRDDDNGADGGKGGRGWASSTNLTSFEPPKKDGFSTGFSRTSSSWTSTPDLGADETETTNAVTVNLKLPKRRLTGPLPSIDTGQESVTLRRPSPSPPPAAVSQPQVTITKNDSLAERVRKMQLLKNQNSFEKESSLEKDRDRRSLSRSKEEEKTAKPKEDRTSTKDDVNFMMQVKSSRSSNTNSKPPMRGGPSRDKDESDDDTSTVGTITTDTTLVDANVREYQEQIESFKQEIDTLKKRCERVEKEKSDILLRRLANIDTANKYTTGRSSEVLKLQQKVNELSAQNEDLRDEKKHLTLRVKEIECELEARPSAEAQARQIEQLRAKLLAAETLCEELMDENEDMKKELRDLEEEIEEMQDNFREDQADEYTSLRKELEQTIKNCRVLSFKLKKTERKNEQLEQEKAEHEKKLLEIVGGPDGLQRENRIKELEQEVARSTEVALRLQRELTEANTKLTAASGAPPANLKKLPHSDGVKVSRSSLTRGGSQEDAAQLLRDLQDSLEREADLREQLRNAEEEACQYGQRSEDRRILPLANYPHLTKHDLESITNEKILEMQQVLEKSVSTTDMSRISIGVNEFTQSPQDFIFSYSEGSQTDTLMTSDVTTDTRKVCLDSGIQCINELLEMYTQTEAAFKKNKNNQTDNFSRNGFSQTDKIKPKNVFVQTAVKLYKNECLQTVDKNTISLNTEDKQQNRACDHSESSNYENNGSINESNLMATKKIPKSDSPPLAIDKTEDVSSEISLSFVSLLNPLAVRMSNIGRKLSPTAPTNRLAIDSTHDKEEKASEVEDPAELKLLLELNEQEAGVLRRKVEELEQDKDSLKKQVKELTDKVTNAATKPTNSTASLRRNTATSNNKLAEERVKVLEDEIDELRKKLIEKERDCERLHAELSLAQKKPKASLIKSKSLDANDQQNVDLKRQLQVIEQEANVLRSKTQSLEADNEKLQAENKKLQLLKNAKSLKSDKTLEQSSTKITKLEKDLKEALDKIKEFENKEKDDKIEKKVRFGDEINKKDSELLKTKQDELDKLKINLTKLEKENAKLQMSLKALKDDAIKSFKPRVSKKVTDLTTKLQLKRMVEELESEIGEMYVVMKNAGLSSNEINTKIQMEKDIEDIRSKLSRNDSEFTNEKNRLQTEIARLKDLNITLEKDKNVYVDKCKTLETDKNTATTKYNTLLEEKKTLESEISKLNADLKNATSLQTTMSDCMKKIEDLKKEMDVKDKEVEKLKKQLENLTKAEQDKNKLLKEVGDKTKKITDLEKKLKESEEKLKRLEKQLSTRKDRVTKLEKEEDSLRDKSANKPGEAVSSAEMAELQEKLEKANRDLEEKENELTKAKQELSNTENELSSLKTETSQLKSDIAKLESLKKEHENKLQAEKKESNYWEKKAADLDTDLQAEKKKVDRIRLSHDKDIKNKEAELATLKGKLKVLEQSSGVGAKKIADLKQEYEETIKKMEHSLAVEKSEYEELTSKYELLEEEHVVTKARLTVEKEQAQGELLHVQKELNAALAEIKTHQENTESQSTAWNKEKSEMQSTIASLQERLCGGGWEVERARLNARLEQRERELRAANDQRDVLEHHHDLAKRELEEIRKKLEDYEKVSKIQRNLTTENAELENELTALNTRLDQAEKARKAELAETKMRYEGQMNTMREELKSLHNQVSRFRRERDNYKQMLDAAQKSISEMKSGDKNARTHRNSISSTDEEEYRNKVAMLEQQVACLEDELCESRLLASKLNTELVSEKSAAEVRLAEMQSRLNEYEEDRLVSSGRARVAGMASRLELAWHKERDEHQRLLQETSTLARDLRQTLFELEREREKERLDMKRRIEQLKRTTEDETEEAKKKVTELQCDLLELRDAHAKLRTANEKLRRDKERHDRDRDQNKLLVASLKRAQQEDDRTIAQLLETIEDLMKQSPDLFRVDPHVVPEKSLLTPTPPRRNRSSKSRSRSATPENGEAGGVNDAKATAARLRRLTDELRASRIAERQRRQQPGIRRAMSTEPRDTLSVTPASRTPSRAPSHSKRSISLEQTTKEHSAIWKSVDESSVSSMQSLDGDDVRTFTMQRDTSLDSRLSGGSTQSDVVQDKKKKKSIFGKLKKLTKSRSIDDQIDPEIVEFRPIGTVSQGSDSDMSTAGSKRDLRGRISGMFSRKGTLSRGNSKELSPERPASSMASISSSSTRPILRNSSSNTLTRASPAKPNEVTSSRASSATPATKRKGK